MADKGKVAEWALKLKEEISGDALKAAKALSDLRDAIKGDKTELAEMQRQMRELKKGTGADLKDAMVSLKAKIDAKKTAIASAKEQYKQMAQAAGVTKTRSDALRAVFQELGKHAQRLPGPLGVIASRLIQMASKMGNTRMIVIGLAAGFVGLAAAIGVALGKLLAAGIASQNARRNELLHLEALTKQRNLWGLMPGKASDMQAAIDRVSASVSISRERVSGYATQLYQAGLRGDNLAAALEGSAIKASALGDQAGGAFASWAGDLALTGGNVKRLSEDVKNRFGGIVQKQMKSLEVSQMKMREGFDSLFTGLNIEAFLNALYRVRNLFSQSTESGRALKTIMGVMLKPLLDAVTAGLTYVRRFYKQMVIGALEITIAYLTVRNWFRKTFGGESVDTLKRFFGTIQWGRTFVYILAAAALAMAAGFVAATWPILLTGAAIWGVITIVQQLYDLWTQIDWKELGLAILQGIGDGILAGWDWAVSKMKELALALQNTFKDVQLIASPSRVFADLGKELPRGVTQGIKEGSPEAQKSAAEMVSTPKLGRGALAAATDAQPAATRPPPRAAATGRSVSVTIQELHVNAKTEEPKAFALAIRRELENALEGLALEMGARSEA